jgi:L-fuculose-phosphate aldolase
MTGKAEAALRAAIVATAQAMSARGLSPGRSGNVSARWGDGLLITPSGVAYDTLAADDIVRLDADGTAPPGALAPSSEWRFHRDIYRARPDAGAVVHAHPLHATALACARKSIPAFHYMVAVAGGSDIPLVPYATFGSEQLSRHVVAGLRERNACLMANHGEVAVAATVEAALELAAEVETLAAMYCKVLAIGRAHVLGDAEMDVVLEKFRHYGGNAGAASKRPQRSQPPAK